MTVALGLALIGYGIYTIWLRSSKPEQFGKLGPMKKFWGARAGVVIHVLGYSVIPILYGLSLLVRGFQGKSIL